MIKNAHEKYYLRFEALGDNPSEKKLEELLNAIHAGIKSGELTKKTCESYIVDMMQWVITTTLNEGKNFVWYREYPPIPRSLQFQYLSKCQSSKEKTKVKNAHEKYYLQFEAFGDNPSTEALKKLLKAIQSGIKSGELTEKTCDMYIVDMMIWVITLTGFFKGKNFGWHRAFPPVPRSIQLRYLKKCQSSKEKPKVKPKPKEKAKVKNAHKKYYLRFKDLGDNSSEEELRSLLEAIQDAIRKRELTSENCDVAVVERMQRVLVEALNGSGRFSFNELLYFSLKPKAKPNTEPKVIELEPNAAPAEMRTVSFQAKAKPKAKASKVKASKVKPKEKPKAKPKVQVTKLFTLKPRSEITLKPSTELQCTLKASPKSTLNTYTQGTNSSTKSSASSSIGSASREVNLVKKSPITNRQGVLIKSAKSIAEQEYNFFKAGAFSKVFGEVAVPFSLMVSGVPGSGKTSFLLQLIKHVSKTYARHRLLFVSNEERFNPSLGTKLKRFDMLDCDNLDIADSLPSNLNDYDFIFLDSVQSLRLSVEDFKQQISQLTSAGICLFFVFQATKSGSFRGSLEYEHEVDISLKVEGGRATVVKNRFGGSGYYKIF